MINQAIKHPKIQIKLTKSKFNKLSSKFGLNKRIKIDFPKPKILNFITKLEKKTISTFKHIKFYKDINCNRGARHNKFLPVRGQRTHTNAKTAKKQKKNRA